MKTTSVDLPWILSELNVPVYGTEFTLALVEGKLEEHNLLDDADLNEMIPGRRLTLGPFSIMPIRVTHSLVDCVALAIHTPVGVVLHTGDFKVDLSPPDNKPFDLHAFAELGKQGVLVLLQDSTNVDRKGTRRVSARFGRGWMRFFRRRRRRCSLVASPRRSTGSDWQWNWPMSTGARSRSSDGRWKTRRRSRRTLVISTRRQGLVINSGQIRDTPANKLLVLISGTQGEPMSALSRAAVSNHKFAKIDAGDTVLLSSRVIPGNEKSIYRVIDHLERRDADVIYDDGHSGLIHVSGHGSQEELRLMINLVRPKFFIPIHGDYRHLKRHVELASSMGVIEKAILLEDGDVLELDKDSATKTGKITVGRVCIDSGGASTDVVEDLVIRDRKHLSEDGIVLPIIQINKRTGKLENAPEIVMRGTAIGEESLIVEARQVVQRTLDGSSAEETADYGVIKEKIRNDLKRYIQKSTSRRPLIMPVILEI